MLPYFRPAPSRMLTPTLALLLLAASTAWQPARAQFGVNLADGGTGVVPVQFSRAFPDGTLRGTMQLTVQSYPEIQLDKGTVRLSPGARIRGPGQNLIMWSQFPEGKVKVNYVRDTLGLITEVWILRPDEIKALWPTSAEEATRWTYDPVMRTWTK